MVSIKDIFKDHVATLNELESNELNNIEHFGKKAIEVISAGNTIFFCGNGGSAGDSQHLAAELTGRYSKDRRSLPGIALTVDSSALTAIANDYGYEQVFSRQLEGLGKAGDMLVGISTSGNSPNIIQAVKTAKKMNIFSVALTGKDGGNLKNFCDLPIIVPSNETDRIQEMHIMIGQIMCEYVEESILVEEG